VRAENLFAQNAHLLTMLHPIDEGLQITAVRVRIIEPSAGQQNLGALLGRQGIVALDILLGGAMDYRTSEGRRIQRLADAQPAYRLYERVNKLILQLSATRIRLAERSVDRKS